MNPSIFKAYDIRGIYPGELNEKSAYQIGRAFVAYLIENEPERPEKFVIGRDGRASSPVLSRAFGQGVADAGVDVLDIGLVPVDEVYFASGRFNWPAAMVTASHNPKEYNGFKLMKKGADVIGIDSGLSDIAKIAMSKNWPEMEEGFGESVEIKRGSVTEQSITDEYSRHVLSFADIPNLRPMRVAIDAGSGAAGPALEEILKKLPLECTRLYFEPDGDFPYHGPNPVLPENLEALKNEIRRHHYHFGCAFDGDGDRIVFVDENGETVSSSVIGALMARHFLKSEPRGKIVHSAITSRVVPEIAAIYGGEAIRERVGHTYISRRLRETGGVFGMETSGHYYFRKNFYADSGIIAFLVMLNILSGQKKSLSALAAEFSKYASMPEKNFKVENPDEFIKKIARNFEGYDLDWLDGLTVRTNDFWINLRPSHTEPVVRLNAEAKDEMTLARVKSDLLALVEKFR